MRNQRKKTTWTVLFFLFLDMTCCNTSKWFASKPHLLEAGFKVRGGDSDNSSITHVSQKESSIAQQQEEPTIPYERKKAQRSSELILDLLEGSVAAGGEGVESLALRQLILGRSQEYLAELDDTVRSSLEMPEKKKELPNPRKLLHYLAPKVPAIKQSPDINLRIHSARSDIDSGVAACILSTLAYLCEVFDKKQIQLSRMTAVTTTATTTKQGESPKSQASESIVSDRRFEQLIECVLSGVNLKKRKLESMQRNLDEKSLESQDIEEILDGKELEESDGLTVRDACRAAWGIAILNAHHQDTLGGESVMDLLLALSLRIRELLLARLQLLRRDDLLSETSLSCRTTVDERLAELSKELAKDAVLAMWSFACVRAFTGQRSAALIETCCSILCQDPVDLRRRAQEVHEDIQRTSIGNNDIVDRLAKAESSPQTETEANINSTKSLVNGLDQSDKDALLDWLSPTEVMDVVWALAMHGSSNSTSLSLDEITLSETAATLSEIAFDRLVEWLRKDLNDAEMQAMEKTPTETEIPAEINEEQSMTVEVVDAAVLLSSQAKIERAELALEAWPIENITLKRDSLIEEGGRQVKVVDAATLLAAAEGEDAVQVETETMIAPEVAVGERAFLSGDDLDLQLSVANKSLALGETDKSTFRRSAPLFSPRDLSNIAWSATELRDPLCTKILPMVIKLVAMLGENGSASLSGADLANLAWAVAKFDSEISKEEETIPKSLSLSVMSWIYQCALLPLLSVVEDEAQVRNALTEFQPPELGRLLWAIASVMPPCGQAFAPLGSNRDFEPLARIALKSASTNLNLFSTEDLLRIGWAYLELYGEGDDAFDPSVALSLGRILSTVEQSLYRWERGDSRRDTSEAISLTAKSGGVALFSTFFGKSRLHQPLLEQGISDQDDEDDHILAPIIQKSRRPLLRDLSVDPSTLCKSACAFQRLRGRHPGMNGGWKLTNVAIRLLSSKNARLMRECSIHDLVRICEAAIRSDNEGHGRELIAGLFAHKVVRVLNDVLNDNVNHSSSVSLAAASPHEIATLIWALGELGAKHSLDEPLETAYRKMKLVATNPLLTLEQVKSLDTASAGKLLRGLILMKYFSTDPEFVHGVLEEEIHRKAMYVRSAEELCQLAESMALLKEALKSGGADSEKRPPEDMGKSEKTKEKESTDKFSLENETDDKSSRPEMPVETRLTLLCDELLEFVAEKLQAFSPDSLSCQEVQRILAVYSLLPFQSDALIGMLDKEVSTRLTKLQHAYDISLDEILQNSMETAEMLKENFFAESESSAFDALKNGVISLFRAKDDQHSEDGNPKISDDLADMIKDSVERTIRAVALVEQKKSTFLGKPLDEISRSKAEEYFFELGRCQELIANYRRMEFSTGTRTSRYDKDRRNDISKRVLSRLLP